MQRPVSQVLAVEDLASEGAGHSFRLTADPGEEVALTTTRIQGPGHAGPAG